MKLLKLIAIPLAMVLVLLDSSKSLSVLTRVFSQFLNHNEIKGSVFNRVKAGYHIGSNRFDSSRKSPKDQNGDNESKVERPINPVERAVLLPWEEGSEVAYLIEKQETPTTNISITVPSNETSSTSIMNFSSSIKPSESSTSSFSSSTVSLLPWEDDSWPLFEAISNSSPSTFLFITAPSTVKMPVTFTGSTMTSTKLPVNELTTGNSSSTPAILSTLSPLPWEEDYFDGFPVTAQDQTSLGPTFKPFDPGNVNNSSSTSSQTPTTIKSTDVFTVTTKKPEVFNEDEPIFNLVPLKPFENYEWSKFPYKMPTTKKIS